MKMSYHYVTIKMEVPVKKWDSIGSHVHCMMTFDVPDNVDEDEYIEDCLDEIMNSNGRYDCEWEYS